MFRGFMVHNIHMGSSICCCQIKVVLIRSSKNELSSLCGYGSILIVRQQTHSTDSFVKTLMRMFYFIFYLDHSLKHLYSLWLFFWICNSLFLLSFRCIFFIFFMSNHVLCIFAFCLLKYLCSCEALLTALCLNGAIMVQNDLICIFLSKIEKVYCVNALQQIPFYREVLYPKSFQTWSHQWCY